MMCKRKEEKRKKTVVSETKGRLDKQEPAERRTDERNGTQGKGRGDRKLRKK